MSNQTMNETEQSDLPANRPIASDADTKRTTRPITSRKVANKRVPSTGKGVSNKRVAGKEAGRSANSQRKRRFSRRQILIALIAFVLVFDATVLGFWFLRGGGGPVVPPYAELSDLVGSQQHNNRNIARIGYDADLTFANYPDLTIVKTSSLKPIENDLFKSGAGPDGADLLYDELIVERVLKLNSDWYDYLNRNNQSVFASVKEGSAAQTKITELGAGSSIAYTQFAIGEIRHVGKNYYIITRAVYTLTQAGQLDIHDDIFVYKLTAQGDTMVVIDFEQIAMNVPPSEPSMVPEGETGEGADTTGEDVIEESTDETVDSSAEESAEESTEESDAASSPGDEQTNGSATEP
jgi:hypothetical protein